LGSIYFNYSVFHQNTKSSVSWVEQLMDGI
jgi:hypothetical protein